MNYCRGKILHAYGDIAGHCGRFGAESDWLNFLSTSVQVSCVNSGMLTFVSQYGGLVCLVQANRVLAVQDENVR